jgi:hypothetical protein
MPAVVILGRRGTSPEVAYVHRSISKFDRPLIDDLLGELDEMCSMQRTQRAIITVLGGEF